MSKHLMQVNVNSNELDEVITTLDNVRSQLMECYDKLIRICVVTVEKEEAASGN